VIDRQGEPAAGMIDTETLHNIASGSLTPPGMVSVVLPHYETPELARLCLRAIRRFTTVPFETIVVDNASGDDVSLEYLRGVSWIRLIERGDHEVPESGPGAHATALNIGLEAARGELVLAMHTDTIARRDGWLREMAEPFAGDERLAALGADKLDGPGPVRSALKALVDGKTYRRLALRLRGRAVAEDPKSRPPHARSFCALYRRSALVAEGLDFYPAGGYAAGEELYHALLSRGYRTRLLPARRMRDLVVHVAHATAYLSPERSIRTGRVRRRTAGRIDRLFTEPWVRALLEDESLDTR